MHPVKVAIFVDLFPPSMGGGATRALQIAQSLASLNFDVTVITGNYHYPRGRSLFSLKWRYENIDNVKIIRVPSVNLPFEGLLNRLINYFFCSIFMLITSPKLKGFNIIISLGMHPFTDFSAYLAKIINPNSHLIIDFSDIFPTRTIYGIVSNAVNRFLLRIADSVTVLNERMEKIFVYLYNPQKRIVSLPNAVNTDVFRPINDARIEKKFLSKFCRQSLRNKIIVCYCGVFGRFQKLANILDAAKYLEEECDNLIFCIIGDGEEKPQLEKLVSNLKLKNLILLPPIKRQFIPFIEAEADVGLVPIVTDYLFLKYIASPTKASEFLSCGTPIIAPKGSFIGSLVLRWNAGYEVDFSRIEEIYKCLKNICQNSLELEIKSRNARLLALSMFSTNALRLRLSEFLIDVLMSIESEIKGKVKNEIK
jgi:glycosyltransferase involved in cell wall biosynthesis